MKYPRLNAPSQGRTYIQQFFGYNATPASTEAEFTDMLNLTSDYFPAIAPRKHRQTRAKVDVPRGIIGKGYSAAYVDGTKLIYDGKVIEMGLDPDTDKQMVSMGAYICIFPDKKKYNTYTEEISNMGEKVTSSAGITFYLDRTAYQENGRYIDIPDGYYTKPKPSNPSDGEMYMLAQISNNPSMDYSVLLQRYYSSSSAWFPVETFQSIKFKGVPAKYGFKEGDFLDFADFATLGSTDLSSLNGTYKISHIAEANGYTRMYFSQISIDSLYYTAIKGGTALSTFISSAINSNASIERFIPNMDFVCELNNRLWGCSSENHEIYACKLGDPDTWKDYSGLATDSYAVTIGSDGDFTGATRYNNTVLFFKENLIHKIIGTNPANFQLNTVYTYGMQKGSSGSITTINEVLYFKSENAVCFYDGSTAEIISNALGNTHYQNASGGTYNNKYYISMQDDKGKWSLFVYDLSRGLWHKEDDLAVYGFAQLSDGAMCMLTHDGVMWWVGRDLEDAINKEEDMKWSLTTGQIGYDSPDHKYLSRFDLRMHIPAGESLNIYIEYDSSGNWIHKGDIRNTGTNTVMLPIVPRRCDHMRVKITGLKTDTRIYSIAKIYEQGSDG